MIVQAGLPSIKRLHAAVERSRLAARDSPEARHNAREGLEREIDVIGLIEQARPQLSYIRLLSDDNSNQASPPPADPPDGRLMVRA